MEINDGFDIASYSMMRSQSSVMAGVSIAMLKNSIDMQEAQAAELSQMMEQSVNPGLGRNIDILI